MRRTERLFAIIQKLRARKEPITARQLADALEVSLRTVYRDTAELIAQGVPLHGDAGIGYRLGAGYDLPPLMLTEDELDAALLGAAWVAKHGDRSLARGAQSLVEKLGQVVSKALRPLLLDASLRPGRRRTGILDGVDLAPIRQAIRERRKVEIHYEDADARQTIRVVWPFLIGFMDEVRIVVAHCEQRGDFRHFRTDRLSSIRILDERQGEPRATLLARWESAFPGRT